MKDEKQNELNQNPKLNKKLYCCRIAKIKAKLENSLNNLNKVSDGIAEFGLDENADNLQSDFQKLGEADKSLVGVQSFTNDLIENFPAAK